MIYKRYGFYLSPSLESKVATLDELMVSYGEGIVSTQLAIDEQTKENITRWENEGIPPSGFMVSHTSLQVDFTVNGLEENLLNRKIKVLCGKSKGVVAGIQVRVSFTPKLFG